MADSTEDQESQKLSMEESTESKETHKPIHEHTHESANDEVNEETLHTFEEQQKRKEHKLQEEFEEYALMRKEQKENELREIEELKRKRIERQKERILEEKRLTEQRKEDDIRRKVEEEERKKKKQEEDEKRRREKERRRMEAERRKKPKTPNFKITKKEGAEVVEEVEKKPPQKTKEELEKQKQVQLASRITPLPDISSMSTNELNELAKDLHNQIWNVVSNMYNLEERFKRTQYDIVELQERARAMSKTKKKGISSVQVDDSYDRMNDKFSNAPPKILVANKFEANVDRRSWKEKLNVFNSKEDLLDINKIYHDYIESSYFTEEY